MEEEKCGATDGPVGPGRSPQTSDKTKYYYYIILYKMVKQEQGSLVFNLQVPEVPPSGQQAAPEQGEAGGGEEAPSAPQHPANPGTQPVPSAQHLVTNVINLNL